MSMLYSDIQMDQLRARSTEVLTFVLLLLMPSSHLACDGSTEPVSCPYPPFRAASVRRQEAAVRFSYGFTGSAASTIWFSEKFNQFGKIVRHVVGGIAQSSHGLRMISVRGLRRLHGNCTDIARFPYNLCTVSVRIYPGLPPRPRRRCP